ncbi:MAG: hypothetical protein U1E73_13885 [Planctomycetota bacterium]
MGNMPEIVPAVAATRAADVGGFAAGMVGIGRTARDVLRWRSPATSTAMEKTSHTAVAALLALAAARAQTVPYDEAIVVAATGAQPATLALAVDLHAGSYTVLPTLPGDAMPPLAVEVDPIDGSVLVALDSGGSTRVVRRRYAQATEAFVGTVPGLAVELLVDRFGDVVVATGGSNGAVQRLPRHGGTAALIRSTPFLSAAGAPQALHWNALLGYSGTVSPPRDPQVADLDLDAGTFAWGPLALTGFQPLGIRGLLDMPTGVPRQILAHDDGSLSLYSWAIAGGPVPLSVSPPLPNGGIAAMKAHEAFVGIVLGGAQNPYLYSFDPFPALGGSLVLTTISTALPGTPVDYAVRPLAGAQVLQFARPCGVAAELRIGMLPGTGPHLGNTAFGLAASQGLPLLPAWLVLGFGELAYAMPTGCDLGVTPDAIGGRWTDANGDASLLIPIPAAAGLVGVRFFGQWLQVDGGTPFLASDVAMVEIGV